MAELEHAYCEHPEPCLCIEFEGKTYPGLESIIDDLVRQRNGLRVIAHLVDGLEAERDDLLDYVRILETRLRVEEQGL